MNLALHLACADLRHFRWLIAGWVLLIGAVAAFDGISPLFPVDSDAVVGFGTARTILWIAAHLMATLMITLVVQAHPTTDRFEPPDFGLRDRRLRPMLLLDSAWLQGAELVVVRAQLEGSVIRSLHIPRLRLETAGG